MANNTIIALDVGAQRIGVAWADSKLKIPFPLLTVPNDEKVIRTIVTLYHDQFGGKVVVGLPRNQQGEETTQSEYSREFAKRLAAEQLPVVFQDESLTSVLAEEELKKRGKPYAKGDIDSLAATLILRDYLESSGL